MPQKQKPEEQKPEVVELNSREKVIVAVYLLQNLKERFELTESENGALDYALYLFGREREWLEEEEKGSALKIEEEDEAGKTPNQSGLPPILKVAKMDNVEGYV